MTRPDTAAAATTALDATVVGEGDFRALMSLFPTGVAVIGAMDGAGRPWGMTCSSLCAVSLSPPVLLVCLRSGSPTLAALERTGAFSVNLLHHSARDVAELFASGDPDRFRRTAWHLPDEIAAGPHLRDAAHAVGDCRVDGVRQVGDHTVVFGRVTRVSVAAGPERVPLLYGLRRYAVWPTSGSVTEPGRSRPDPADEE
ncbi:flavin reductase family protein [Streptomyces sp. NEAU-W12]|uniref:flavin reductase family protein n=1 Tax=Streptomyces sp. NEAU-W12 TaxID=2994668 RepID=UPI00224A8CEE|nr:flavin reductase family protein [Streptomyces sp. NEAU-W12]MCX2926909.1 flavin reductase family protein [Streptomyces sp. NEAU-W12]